MNQEWHFILGWSFLTPQKGKACDLDRKGAVPKKQGCYLECLMEFSSQCILGEMWLEFHKRSLVRNRQWLQLSWSSLKMNSSWRPWTWSWIREKKNKTTPSHLDQMSWSGGDDRGLRPGFLLATRSFPFRLTRRTTIHPRKRFMTPTLHSLLLAFS